MSWAREMRKLAIIACGIFTSSIALLSPVTAAGEEDCLEPWLERCITTTEACVDCDKWCQVHVGGACVAEWFSCEEDLELCPPPQPPIHESCSCKPADT